MIETKRLTLREFTLDDREEVFRLSQEEGIKRWLNNQTYANEEKAATVLSNLIEQYRLRDSEVFVLAIDLKHPKKLIGHIGYSTYDDEYEIGFAIADEHKRKGYAKEAIKAFTEFSFMEHGVSLIAVVEKDNKASIHTVKSCGYKKVKEFQNKIIFESELK
ncbi:MAG: GNAT family N-acetyltransferase [Clostridia bacterium]|nr:GNAT family N-acetyltransferase [Clostridia bacterium]